MGTPYLQCKNVGCPYFAQRVRWHRPIPTRKVLDGIGAEFCGLAVRIRMSWAAGPAIRGSKTVSWDASIVKDPNDDSVPLGDLDVVLSKLSAAVPGLVMEKPPIPPPETLAMMPDVIREAALRNDEYFGSYEDDELYIAFMCYDHVPAVRFISLEVRGRGNPLPILAAIAAPNGWSVVDSSDDSVVDLSAATIPGWEEFRTSCNEAFGQESG
jgi:hypothetical protein